MAQHERQLTLLAELAGDGLSLLVALQRLVELVAHRVHAAPVADDLGDPLLRAEFAGDGFRLAVALEAGVELAALDEHIGPLAETHGGPEPVAQAPRHVLGLPLAPDRGRRVAAPLGHDAAVRDVERHGLVIAHLARDLLRFREALERPLECFACARSQSPLR